MFTYQVGVLDAEAGNLAFCPHHQRKSALGEKSPLPTGKAKQWQLKSYISSHLMLLSKYFICSLDTSGISSIQTHSILNNRLVNEEGHCLLVGTTGNLTVWYAFLVLSIPHLDFYSCRPLGCNQLTGWPLGCSFLTMCSSKDQDKLVPAPILLDNG